MKKVFINCMFFLCVLNCFSQSDNRMISGWITVEGAKDLKFKVINYNYDNEGNYYWGIIVKNNYTQAVSFKYRLSVGGIHYAKGFFSNVYDLQSGDEFKDGNSLVTALIFKSSSLEYKIEIKDLKFLIAFIT